MDEARTLPLAAGFGALAGSRTFMGPLAVARAARTGHLVLDGTPLSFANSATGAHILAALAVGELIADKTPYIPSRTDPPALIGRFASGALAGATAAKARKGNWLIGAILGGAAAVGVTYVTYELRRRAGEVTKLPDSVFALLEDALVVGSGLALIAATDE